MTDRNLMDRLDINFMGIGRQFSLRFLFYTDFFLQLLNFFSPKVDKLELTSMRLDLMAFPADGPPYYWMKNRKVPDWPTGPTNSTHRSIDGHFRCRRCTGRTRVLLCANANLWQIRLATLGDHFASQIVARTLSIHSV